MSRLKAILIALDQLAAAVIVGWPDATLSAWAYVWARDGKRAWPMKIIDRLFWFDANHCYASYLSEARGAQYPPGFIRKGEA